MPADIKVKEYQRRTKSGQVITVKSYDRTASEIAQEAAALPGRPPMAASQGKFANGRSIPDVYPTPPPMPKASATPAAPAGAPAASDATAAKAPASPAEAEKVFHQKLANQILGKEPPDPKVGKELVDRAFHQKLSDQISGNEPFDPEFAKELVKKAMAKKKAKKIVAAAEAILDPNQVSLARPVHVKAHRRVAKSGKVEHVDAYTYVRDTTFRPGSPKIAAKQGITTGPDRAPDLPDPVPLPEIAPAAVDRPDWAEPDQIITPYPTSAGTAYIVSDPRGVEARTGEGRLIATFSYSDMSYATSPDEDQVTYINTFRGEYLRQGLLKAMYDTGKADRPGLGQALIAKQLAWDSAPPVPRTEPRVGLEVFGPDALEIRSDPSRSLYNPRSHAGLRPERPGGVLGPEGPPVYVVNEEPTLPGATQPMKGFWRATDKTEPISQVYRAMTVAEWQQAQERGYIQSDARGAISSAEGTNAGLDLPTALSYTPRMSDTVIARIDVKPEDGWFTIGADSYLRTRDPIPLDRVSAHTSSLPTGGSGEILDDLPGNEPVITPDVDLPEGPPTSAWVPYTPADTLYDQLYPPKEAYRRDGATVEIRTDLTPTERDRFLTQVDDVVGRLDLPYDIQFVVPEKAPGSSLAAGGFTDTKTGKITMPLSVIADKNQEYLNTTGKTHMSSFGTNALRFYIAHEVGHVVDFHQNDTNQKARSENAFWRSHTDGLSQYGRDIPGLVGNSHNRSEGYAEAWAHWLLGDTDNEAQNATARAYADRYGWDRLANRLRRLGAG